MRVKYILQAPEGVSESVIEGTPYWPDEDNRIETTNPNHLPVLKLHGYKVVTEVALAPPVRVRTHTPIDVDDLGRTGLIDALQARGVSFPEVASRQDLAEIATSWNTARAAPQTARAAPPPRPMPTEAPRAAAPADLSPPAQVVHDAAPAPATDKAPHDFAAYGYEDLKGWLSARGVAFQGNAAKKVLIELATKFHAGQLETEAV